MNDEVKKLNLLIKTYVYYERNKNQRQQALQFYTKCTNIFGYENALNQVPSPENQMKQLKEVRNRFWKNYSPTSNKRDADDFHRYFYQKFLDEIRIERKRTTGVSYSKKSANYVDRKLNRA